jgi:hypothetical protein
LVTQLLSGLPYVLADGTLLVQFITSKYILKTNDGAFDDASSTAAFAAEHEINELPLPGAIVAGAMLMAHASATDWAQPYTGGRLPASIFPRLCSLILNGC